MKLGSTFRVWGQVYFQLFAGIAPSFLGFHQKIWLFGTAKPLVNSIWRIGFMPRISFSYVKVAKLSKEYRFRIKVIKNMMVLYYVSRAVSSFPLPIITKELYKAQKSYLKS